MPDQQPRYAAVDQPSHLPYHAAKCYGNSFRPDSGEIMPLLETPKNSSGELSPTLSLSIPRKVAVVLASILVVSGGLFLVLLSLAAGSMGGSWSIGGAGETFDFPPWFEDAMLWVGGGLLVLGVSVIVVALFTVLRLLSQGFETTRKPTGLREDSPELAGGSQAAVAQSVSRVSEWISGLSIAVVTTMVFFLVIDWGVGLVFPGHRSAIESKFPVEITRMPTPYTMFTGLAEGKIQNEALNRMGYRGAAPPPFDGGEEVRIFMLGGSTVFNGEPPIAALLQERFHQAGFPQVAVYNFGVLSSVSGMELSRIVHEIADLTPDLILMYNGANDIIHPYFWDPRPGYPFNFIVYENHPLLESDIRTYPTLPLLAYGSHILRRVGSRYFLDRFVPQDEERRAVGYASDPWRKEIARKYVGNLNRAARVAAAFDAEFLAFFQPLLFFRDQPTAEERALNYSPEVGMHCNDVRDKIRAQVGLLPGDLRSRLVDLSDVYDGVPTPVFVDLTHTTQQSKDLIAEVLYQEIVKRLPDRLGAGPDASAPETAGV
ncbi:MAG: hypothetical protein AAF657_14175 [Acidobacteriota bacterium]